MIFTIKSSHYPRLIVPWQIVALVMLSTLILSSLPTYAQEKSYIVGVVPQFEARRLHAIWRPILNYLEQETGHRFKIKGSPTISAFEYEFMQGDFDFAYMNPFHIMLANEEQGYIPLVRDAGKTLHGVLVVNQASGIKDISQLQDKIIAFPAPNALGASLLMRQELRDVFHIDFKPMYVKTHDSVYLNVLMRRAAAGGGVQKTLRQQKPEYQAALTIIHKTRAVAPHPLVAHPKVAEPVRTAVKQALLKLGQTPDGLALLAKIPIKQIGPASMADYLPLKELGLKRFYVK